MAQIYTRLKPQFENIAFEKRDDNSMVLNFGPQHPSTHGQLRLVLELDGEQVKKAHPEIGYLHRGIEKLAENMIYNEFMPTTDRLDYIAASSNNYAFALGLERLIGLEVPRKAQVIRTTILELNRIISHIFFIAVHAMDVGALSLFLYAFKTREYGLDLMEDYCGARLTHNAIRIGGVPLDFPQGWLENLAAFLKEVQKSVELFEGLLDNNRIWLARLEGVGVIDSDRAKSWGASGIMLRATGIKYDIRKEEPYELYDELDFCVPVGHNGDSYDRYRLYMLEIRESCKILEQLIELYPSASKQCENLRGGGLLADAPSFISAPKEEIMTQNYSLMQHFVLVTQGMRPPKGEVYVPTESPRGELGFFIHSLGNPYPQRVKIKTPSFAHTALLQEMLVGEYIADIVTIVGSCNAIFGEVDR